MQDRCEKCAKWWGWPKTGWCIQSVETNKPSWFGYVLLRTWKCTKCGDRWFDTDPDYRGKLTIEEASKLFEE